MKEKNTPPIPFPNRDGNLISRLFPIVVGGLDKKLEIESQMYIRLLVRLGDCAYNSYEILYNLLLCEIESKNKLSYSFRIANEFDFCIYTLNRLLRIFDYIKNGIPNNENGREYKKNLKIALFIDENKINKKTIKEMRDRVEYLGEDIQKMEITDGVMIKFSDDYSSVKLNNVSINLKSLSEIVEKCHDQILNILLKAV